MRHWHSLLRNNKHIGSLKKTRLPVWLRFSNTTWAESEQYAVGLTTGEFSEVFVDKIAIWCYETYIYENLCDKVPELRRIVSVLESKVFGTHNKNQLQSKAAEIINTVLFKKAQDCTGAKKHGKCSSHQQLHEIPEGVIVGMIGRLISEASVHEIIHATLFEYTGVQSGEIDPRDVTEQTVYDYAMQIAGTADIARSRV